MASTYTQFARNALCLGKTFLPSNHFLRSLAVPAAPAPFNSVSLIELAVAVTQFAGLGFFVQSGLARILSGANEFKVSKNSLSTIDRLSILNHNKIDEYEEEFDNKIIKKVKNSPLSSSLSFTLLRQHLLNKIKNSSVKYIVGYCHLLVAIAFLVLFTNSLHIKLPGHPKSVINAVIILEIGLAYMLTSVYASGKENYKNYLNIKNLINLLKNENKNEISNENLLKLATKTGFVDNLMEIYCNTNTNFNVTTSSIITNDNNILEKDINNDLDKISCSLNDKILSSTGSTSLNLILNDLIYKSNEYFFNSIITFLFFGLNFIAGYGYLLIILDFYFPEASLKG